MNITILIKFRAVLARKVNVRGMNVVLRALILSDLFLYGGFGLIQPIFAVFMLQEITGSSVMAIGVATTIQLVTKSILQLGIAKWTDAEPGNRRELLTLFAGSLIMSVVPFAYLWATALHHVFILQFVYGLGTALAYPGWIVIFARYTDDSKRGYEYSVYNTTIGLGVAAAAVLGGYFVQTYSFQHLFVLIGILSVIGAMFILTIFKKEFTHFHFNKDEIKTLWQNDIKLKTSRLRTGAGKRSK